MSSDKKAPPRSGWGDQIKSSMRAVGRGLKRTQLEAELGAAHRRLGKAVAEHQQTNPFLPDSLAAEMGPILELQRLIAETRHDSGEAPGPAPCPGCQQIVPQGAAFCPGCGRKVQ